MLRKIRGFPCLKGEGHESLELIPDALKVTSYAEDPVLSKMVDDQNLQEFLDGRTKRVNISDREYTFEGIGNVYSVDDWRNAITVVNRFAKNVIRCPLRSKIR